MIGPGEYMTIPTAWGLLEKSENAQSEQFAIEFEVVEGPQSGERITAFLSFSDKAFKYTMEKIRAAGLMGGDLTDLRRNTDAPVRIFCKEDTYNGKTTVKVAFVGERKGIGKTMDAQEARSFAARMKGQIAAYDAEAGGGTAAKPASRPAATTPRNGTGAGGFRAPMGGHDDESDIPFARSW